MCGFAGFTYSDEKLLAKMGATLKKRAIDDERFYTTGGYSYYHAHLKISDLDKNTCQPFVTENLVVGLVGEIYNKQEILHDIGVNENESLYTELEVISLAYEKLGETFIDIVNGEFAISIYDIAQNVYLLYRDRWGVNNVYFRVLENQLYYASEIKTLILSTPKCSKKSMIDHMIFQFGISPETIVDDVYILRPGTYLRYQNGEMKISDFSPYSFKESDSSIIDSLEKSVQRRIPHFQDKIFIGLSGGPDSNLILYFLKQHYKGEIIAYSFFTDKNTQDIEVAKRNAKKQGVKHLLIDMNEFQHTALKDDLYTHEGLVYLPDLGKILKEKFPEYANVKVEFGGDGKEELILGNNHYPYKEILLRHKYFTDKGLSQTYTINQEFLNKEMFDYNLQMIDKLTLRNGIERRLPFTDNEMLRFFKYKNYRKQAEEFLYEQGLEIVPGEYGYDLGIKFENVYDKKLSGNMQTLMQNFSNNIII